jgi:hypothetical protein
MKVYIPSPSGKAREYNVTPETTVKELFKMVTEKEGIPFPGGGYTLRYGGKSLLQHKDKSLKNLAIGNNARLFLTSQDNNDRFHLDAQNNGTMGGGKRKKNRTMRRKNKKSSTRRNRK